MTLTELMVVVVIMLLIAVVSIPLLAPNDDQKGREAALTATTAVSRAVARAEDNGPRGAGLWLEPLDPARDGRLVSRGVLDLFACQGQDPYQGDDPEVGPLVFAYQDQAAGAAPNEAVLLFSTRTSGNIREYCSKASRITIQPGGSEYYFLLLTPEQQKSYAAPSQRNLLLPEPYRPTTPPRNYPLAEGEKWDEKRWGFYNTKPLDDALWSAHNEPQSNSGGVFLGYAQAIPPSVSPPPNSPKFDAGVPEGALYDEHGNKSERRKEGGEAGEMEPVPLPFRPPGALPAIDTGSTYSIRRPITRSATPPLSLPAGFGVDIAWSTFGRYLLADAAEAQTRPGTGNRLEGLPGLLSNHPVCVMFSQRKDIAAVVYHHPVQIGSKRQVIEERLVVTGDVYLLIGRLDRAGLPFEPSPSKDRPGANWQYPDSRWVKISRNAGGTLIADPVLSVGDVFDSQGYARLGLEAAKQ